MDKSSQPNVIVITTHDTGTLFGCYGASTVNTPNIDKLASQGVRFEKMFATCSICSPSRGSLLTGRYPQSNGLTGLAGHNWKCELNDTHQHLSHIMRDNDYNTVFVGYQHETNFLDQLGFDDVSRAHKFQCANFTEEGESRDGVDLGESLEQNCKIAPETARDATTFLSSESANEKPFYMQIGFWETHTPYLWGGCEPDTSKGMEIPEFTQCSADEQWREIKPMGDHMAALQGSIKMVDDAVGIICESLEKNGLAENTILLFTVDHGPELPRAKWTLHDAALRVAFIMRWPAGNISGGKTVSNMACNVDYVPTLGDLAGLNLPDNIEGKSLAGLLSGEEVTHRDTSFAIFIYPGLYSARTENYRLIRHINDETNTTELYDLKEDPLELNDLSKDENHQETLKDMNDRLCGWLSDVNDPILEKCSAGCTL
ncbi:MAG: sulfatase [Lentisphaeria bacterium]|nr:sulfatase [Lentisphaeria bacterium]